MYTNNTGLTKGHSMNSNMNANNATNAALSSSTGNGNGYSNMQTSSGSGSGSVLTSSIGGANYRKFAHRRIHTEVQQPTHTHTNTHNNYLNNPNINNSNKYHPYQFQPTTNAVGQPYKKDFNKAKIDTYLTSSIYSGSQSGNPNAPVPSSLTYSNRIGTINSNNLGASTNTNNLGTKQLSKQAIGLNLNKQGYNRQSTNSNTNVPSSTNRQTEGTTLTKNYKFLNRNNNGGYTKYLKTEPDSNDNQPLYASKIRATNRYPANNNQIINNKYQIQGIAGKGTFGTVFYGRVLANNEKIALKKVLQDKKYKNRELEILKEVKHTNILVMKDYFITTEGSEEYLNVIMDYYSDNLYQVIKKKQINPFLIKLYTYQILRGLNYLTMLSIAHRDIKPQNILVDRNTHKVVICDFGSAKRLVKGEPNIAYICSRCYRAPELIFGATQYTPQIDMWSLGCVIVQMINGEAPFLGDSQIDQLLQIIKILGTPQKTDIQEMNPKYDLKQHKKFPNIKPVAWRKILKTQDALLVDLVSKILEYSPKKRFTAAQAMLHPYFDQLKQLQQNQNKEMQCLKKIKVKKMPQLFNYSQEELSSLVGKQESIQNKKITKVKTKRQLNDPKEQPYNFDIQTHQIQISKINKQKYVQKAKQVEKQKSQKKFSPKIESTIYNMPVNSNINNLDDNDQDKIDVEKQVQKRLANLRENPTKIEKNIYTGSSSGTNSKLGTGSSKLVQRKIPGLGLVQSSGITGTISKNVGDNPVSSQNYGKIASNRFQFN